MTLQGVSVNSYSAPTETVKKYVLLLILGGREVPGQKHQHRRYSLAQGRCLPLKDNGIMLNCRDN